MTVTFEGYERRADKINKCLADNGIASLEDCLLYTSPSPRD